MTAFRLPTALALACLLTLGATASAQAQPSTGPTALRVATWNLGWHLDSDEARRWIGACGQPFALDTADQLWKPAPGAALPPATPGTGSSASAASPATGLQPGWALKWGRNAPIAWDIGLLPPCDVYQAQGRILPVTEAALAERQRRIATLLAQQVQADIIAFQEVSGEAAVRQVLPGGGAGWQVCSYTGHKVQRLAIAWKSSLGAARSCQAHWPLSLPERPAKDQPRPGLALTLEVGGQLLRVLNVHLKSSCVSPLDDTVPDGRGQLAGAEPNCQVLQAQLAPLEAWVEAEATRDKPAALVLLGDFNRNLAHDAAQPASAPVRTQGTAEAPHHSGARSHNLWRELNDGVPAASALTLVPNQCPGSAQVQGLCTEAGTRRLNRDEYRAVAAAEALGCRNPIGLDFITLAGAARAVGPARKQALGAQGFSQPPAPGQADAQLALSDHCPVVLDMQIAR